jgi:hypothetical protein
LQPRPRGSLEKWEPVITGSYLIDTSFTIQFVNHDKTIWHHGLFWIPIREPWSN